MLPKREDMRPAPLSPYALQKLIGEQYCQMFTRLYGLETVVTRYFNVFGPRQQPGSPYSGVISLFIEALADGRAPMVHGDGKQTRDFTYVGDVVTGVLRCCEAPNVAGEVINVAAGGRISLLELIRSLQMILKTNVAPSSARRAKATSATRRPTSERRASCSASRPRCRSKRACGKRSRGSRRVPAARPRLPRTPTSALFQTTPVAVHPRRSRDRRPQRR